MISLRKFHLGLFFYGLISGALIGRFIPTPWVFAAIAADIGMMTFVSYNSFIRPAAMASMGVGPVTIEHPNHIGDISLPRQRNGEQIEKEEGEDNAT